MRDERERGGIVIFGDQARYFVDLAGDHEVFQESFEREVGEGHLRGHAFLRGVCGDTCEVIARTRGRCVGQQRFEIGEGHDCSEYSV